MAKAKISIMKKRPAAIAKAYTVHLIDALPYVFRAYYALPGSIKDPAGRQSNAVVGFANFLLKYIADEAPTHLALCFDRSLTTSFRNKLFPAYKANRSLPDAGLKGQIERCRKFAEALGIACFDDPRYEADDLLASLAKPLAAAGHSCLVVTSDKDLCQLVGPRVLVYDYAKGERHNTAGVKKRLGVRPEQVVDFLGLAGDAVDNIPGVKGVGAKTATMLLAKFKDLESIHEGLHRILKLRIRGAEGLVDRLLASKSQAFLSRKLATLVRNVRMRKNSLSALRRRTPQGVRLNALLEDVGLTRLKERIGKLPRNGVD